MLCFDLSILILSVNLVSTVSDDKGDQVQSLLEECDFKEMFEHRRDKLSLFWEKSTEINSYKINNTLYKLENQLFDFMKLIETDEYREIRRYMTDNWKAHITWNMEYYLQYFNRLSTLVYFLNLVKKIYLLGQPVGTNQEEYWKSFREYLLTWIENPKEYNL